jgi:hypothetical protein
MNTLKFSSVILIAGSVLFLIAAFSPISRIFGIPSAEVKLQIILSSPNQWLVAQILFALGAIVTVVGVGMIGHFFNTQSFSVFLSTSTMILLAGAFLWSWHVYLRAIDPRLFVDGKISVWYFALYTFLTQIGLVLFGIALLRMEIQDWVGWMVIGSTGIFFLLTIIFRDMPPFVYYIITMIAGIKLYSYAAHSP